MAALLSKDDRLQMLKQAYKRYCKVRARVEAVSVCMDSSLFYEDDYRDIESVSVPIDPIEPVRYPEMDTTVYANFAPREGEDQEDVEPPLPGLLEQEQGIY